MLVFLDHLIEVLCLCVLRNEMIIMILLKLRMIFIKERFRMVRILSIYSLICLASILIKTFLCSISVAQLVGLAREYACYVRYRRFLLILLMYVMLSKVLLIVKLDVRCAIDRRFLLLWQIHVSKANVFSLSLVLG